MATDGPVNRWNGVDYAAADERLLASPLLMPGPVSAPFSARSGRRVNGAGLAVSVGGSPEAWTVTPGPGVIYGSAHPSAGGWAFALPNAKTENLPARPGVGLSRIDLIVARIYDTDVIGSGSREFKVERVTGTPNASPAAPSLPALSFELGRMVVPNSGVITVTQSIERTTAAGGVLPITTTVEMEKLKTDNIAYRGLVVHNAQTDSLHRYDGTNWKRQIDASSVSFGNVRWGVAYDSAIHGPREWSDTIAGPTSAGGVLNLLADLSTKFAGVGSVQLTAADTSGGLRYALGVVNVNALEAYCYIAAGTGVVSSAVRVDVVVKGWR